MTVGASRTAPQAWVIQGDQCYTVQAIQGDRRLQELYDYRIPSQFTTTGGGAEHSKPYYTSVGTTQLQEANTTLTFLYDGPEGLSLVVVHDSSNGSGGSVTWTVYGLDQGGNWVVRDDYYVDPDSGEIATSNVDNWDVDGDPHQIDWTWRGGRTDGGAFRPLGDRFHVTIDPAFNEDAALWDQYYQGRVTDWQFLTGSLSDPDRVSLALDQPVRVTTVGCSGVRRLQFSVKPGQDVATPHIDPRQPGTIPVGIYESELIDLDSIVPSSLRFGPPDVVSGGGGAAPQTLSRDGDTLLVQFPIRTAGFSLHDTEARIVGKTRDGSTVAAVKSISTPPIPQEDDGLDSARDGNNRDDAGANGERESAKQQENREQQSGEDEATEEETDEEPDGQQSEDQEGAGDDQNDTVDETSSGDDGETQDDTSAADQESGADSTQDGDDSDGGGESEDAETTAGDGEQGTSSDSSASGGSHSSASGGSHSSASGGSHSSASGGSHSSAGGM